MKGAICVKTAARRRALVIVSDNEKCKQRLRALSTKFKYKQLPQSQSFRCMDTSSLYQFKMKWTDALNLERPTTRGVDARSPLAFVQCASCRRTLFLSDLIRKRGCFAEQELVSSLKFSRKWLAEMEVHNKFAFSLSFLFPCAN